MESDKMSLVELLKLAGQWRINPLVARTAFLEIYTRLGVSKKTGFIPKLYAHCLSIGESRGVIEPKVFAADLHQITILHAIKSIDSFFLLTTEIEEEAMVLVLAWLKGIARRQAREAIRKYYAERTLISNSTKRYAIKHFQTDLGLNESLDEDAIERKTKKSGLSNFFNSHEMDADQEPCSEPGYDLTTSDLEFKPGKGISEEDVERSRLEKEENDLEERIILYEMIEDLSPKSRALFDIYKKYRDGEATMDQVREEAITWNVKQDTPRQIYHRTHQQFKRKLEKRKKRSSK